MGLGASASAITPRKSSEASTPAASLDRSISRPTTFFLANEETVERSESIEPGTNSTFGVQSLQETTSSIDDDGRERPAGESNDMDDGISGDSRRRSTLSTLKPSRKPREASSLLFDPPSPTSTADSSPQKPLRRSSPPSASHSLASLSQASQDPGLSSPSSLQSTSNGYSRPSDEESMDEGGSQAIASSEDEAEVSHEVEDSAPQLIMPSIKMPSRRPFTTRGNEVGRLKMLIAGNKGSGKTSLIKSVVQTCEDIVHVDAISPLPSSTKPASRRGKGREESTGSRSTECVTEVFASTRAYPSWWAEVGESKVLRRRRSIDDTILERNVCFVDTPGHSHGTSVVDGIDPVQRYIEEQLVKTLSYAGMTESELVNVLGGNGGLQVDLVLYLVDWHIHDTDLEILKRLSTYTNVIPLLSKADLLSEDEVKASKTAISEALQRSGIKPFTFNPDDSSQPLYTVCSVVSKDEENMDASLLMSPDYVQPLLSSDLALLVQQIFDKQNISRLRHLAAMKLVRNRTALFPVQPSSPLHFSPSTLSASQTLTHYTNSSSSYIQARITDHTLREERLAQARLAKWATDLQRGLHNERARYEALALGERAVWLTKRLGECVNEEGSLVPASATGVGKEGRVQWPKVDAGDPLGLVRWSDVLRRRGWVVLEVVGGFGVLGAVAMWVARGWVWDSGGEGGWWGWWGGRG